MTAPARELLAAFDKLSPPEKHAVMAEILRRSAQNGDLPESALAELANELFCKYDAAEAALADS